MDAIGTVEGHLFAAGQALRQGRAREALDEARAALRLQPEFGRALSMMGVAYAAMGEEVEAREVLVRAVELAPLDPAVEFHFYAALVRLRDLPGARVQLTYLTELDHGHTEARQVLAKLGGPVPDLPPLPHVRVAAWYDGGGHALTNAEDDDPDEPGKEPPPGPDVTVCPECSKRTWKGWVCKHCSAALPRV